MTIQMKLPVAVTCAASSAARPRVARSSSGTI
jgi:hypothetical protein